ncbi:MAG TPA: hypothetical protein EYH50_04570 [Pyrodictium delaneyi]|uniref:Geranylgeranylglycerol-phosphate geranylgeranyltransferase n=1 Tax=Pyrodictium delaneyi TaxID=1273541 RepID=A0A832ZV55_9CREN|nr:hypothetical protein [Pyrodictium delaneyi]
MARVVQLLKGIAELTRPHNLLVAAVTTLIGYGLVSKVYGYQLIEDTFAQAALIVMFVAAAGYMINDYYDIETDRVAKPWRPLVSGTVQPNVARILAYIFFLLGIIASTNLGPCVAVFVIVNVLLLHEYSRWVKKTGFIGNIVVALNSAATVLFGGLVRSVELGAVVPYAVLLPAVYAFLLVLGREVVKGIEDVEGDKHVGISTVAVKCGVVCARRVAALLLGLVVAISPLPAVTGLYNWLYVVFAAIVDVSIAVSLMNLYRASSYHELIVEARRARSLLKLGFLAGGVAFTAGLL